MVWMLLWCHRVRTKFSILFLSLIVFDLAPSAVFVISALYSLFVEKALNIDISHFLYILYRWETWPTSSTCTSFCYVIISIFPYPLVFIFDCSECCPMLSLVLVDSHCVFLSSLPACSSSYLLDMIFSHCLECNIYHVISAIWKIIHPWL